MAMTQGQAPFCPRCGTPMGAGQQVCARCGLDMTPWLSGAVSQPPSISAQPTAPLSGQSPQFAQSYPSYPAAQSGFMPSPDYAAPADEAIRPGRKRGLGRRNLILI